MGKIIAGNKRWKSVDVTKELIEGKVDGDQFNFLVDFEELETYEEVKPGTEAKAKRQRKRQLKKKTKPGKLEEAAEKRRRQEATWSAQVSEHSTRGRESIDVSAWENLSIAAPIVRALADLGFQRPTPIQELTIPAAIQKCVDVVGAAETGSGKTLAYAIPIVHHILSKADTQDAADSEDNLQALVLTPTRELAIQVKQHIQAILQHTELKVAVVIGGLAIQKQRRLLKRRPHIIVATPGRLWELIEEGNEVLSNVQGIRYLVVDETDRMVEKGHFAELEKLLSFLWQDKDATKRRQTFVFSATLTFVHQLPKRLQDKKNAKPLKSEDKVGQLAANLSLRKNYEVFDVSGRLGKAGTLTETRINCATLLEKDASLYYFLRTYSGRALVFCNSVDCTRRLCSLLTRLKFTPYNLFAKMHQKQRLKNLEQFAGTENAVLLATDVAARGLDIRNVQHVIHYQLPRTTEIYVHRSGRTARASHEGLSVMLVDPTEAAVYKKICRNLNRNSDLPIFPLDRDRLSRMKELVGVATELERAEHQLKRSKSKAEWFKRNAEAMDLDMDDDDMRKNLGDQTAVLPKTALMKKLELQLASLLSQPDRHQHSVTKYPAYAGNAPLENELQLSQRKPIEIVRDERKLSKNRTTRFGGKIKLNKASKNIRSKHQ